MNDSHDLLRGKTILLVEDNPQNLELAGDLLTLAGATVMTAKDAEQALEIVGQQAVDVVLMDISLPGMDGLEATRRMKALDLANRPAVVALTAHAMKGDRERSLAAGCDGHLTKPIETRAFAAQVAQFLHVESKATP